MKNIIGLLCVLILFLVGMLQFLNSNGILLDQFLDKFDATVNIVSKPENARKNIVNVQKVAKKHNLSFIKDTYVPKNNEKEQAKVNVFVFLHDAEWFKSEFRNISLTESHRGLNKFGRSDSFTLLTTKKVNLKPFEKINNNYSSGDYHLKGSSNDIDEFIDTLNRGGFGIQAKQVYDFSLPSDYTQAQFFMCMTILSILIVALLFCCIVYNSFLSREFAVSALLGHNKLRFCLKKVVSLTFIPFPVSFVALNITLYVLTGSGNFFRYIYAVKTLYPASAIVMALIFAMEFVLLLFKVSGLRPVYVLKGYGKTYGKLTAVFKILSIATVLYMSVITLFSAYQYLHLKPNIDKWNNSKNYVDIYCTWPSTYERDDEKLQKKENVHRLPKIPSLENWSLKFNDNKVEASFAAKTNNYYSLYVLGDGGELGISDKVSKNKTALASWERTENILSSWVHFYGK